VTLVQNVAKAFQKALRKALGNVDRIVQELNNSCTDPSGQKETTEVAKSETTENEKQQKYLKQ
jgi:hypothetical protein